MGRKPRIMYNGALHHIIQRGNNRNYIYEDVDDKKMFFNLLLDSKEKHGFEILYYVLMDNHYHLVLESGDVPISKGIQWLNTAYSKYYNKRYCRTGTIYGGRYTPVLIRDTKYYCQLLKYIALNPCRAGIANKPENYRWSAHLAVKAGDRKILNIDRLLSYLPSPADKSLADYISLIENNKEMISGYGFLPIKDEQKRNDVLEDILRRMNVKEDCILRIQKGEKSPELVEIKAEFIHIAHAEGFKTKEIAAYLSYSYEAVRKKL